MAIFLSAGHSNFDSGAIGNGYQENKEMIIFRDLVHKELLLLNAKVIIDKDSETLSQYIARIKPGSGSVLCEFHLNASSNATATGCESLYPSNGNQLSKDLSKEISDTISKCLGIKNRGAKDENTSARKRLAILRTPAGISALPEICFISNKQDMIAYQNNKHILAKCIASILIKYENMKD